MNFAETAFKICEIIGTVAFAISGAMVATDKGTDIFGVVFMAVITAFGGGMIRDVLLGRFPAAVFKSAPYVILSIAVAICIFICAYIFKEKYRKNEPFIERITNVFDAIGLGAFAVTGVRVALDSGFGGAFLSITMGMITAIGGGLIRDLMLMEIPFVFKKRIYALAAIAGAAIYYVMYLYDVNVFVSIAVGIFATFAVRMLATVFKWQLPKISQ